MTAALLGATQCLAQTTRGDSLVIGEVRVDGLLVPVALWNGRWWEPFRDNDRRAPPNFAGRWYYKRFTGESATIRVTNRVIRPTDEMTYDYWGLSTSRITKPIDLEAFSVERSGVATSRPLQLQMVSALTPRERSLAREALLKHLAEETTKHWKPSWVPALPRDSVAFEARAVRIDSLGTLVNVTTQHPIANDQGCPWTLYLSGWVVIRGDSATLLGKANFDDCDGKSAGSFLDAIAAFELGGRTFVLAGVRGYESRDASIYEWNRSTVVQHVSRDGEADPVLEPPGPIATKALSLPLRWRAVELRRALLYVAESPFADSLIAHLADIDQQLIAIRYGLGAPAQGPKLRLFFASSQDDIRPLTGLSPPEWSAPEEGAVFFGTGDSARPSIRERLTRVLARREWGPPAEEWPPEGLWFVNLTTCSATGLGIEEMNAAMARAGVMVPFDSVRRNFAAAGELHLIHRLQAAGLMAHVQRKYGVVKLRALWSGGLRKSVAILGIGATALEREWRARVAATKPPGWDWARISGEIHRLGCN